MDNCISIVESINGISTIDYVRKYLVNRLNRDITSNNTDSTDNYKNNRNFNIVYFSVLQHDINRTINIWKKNKTNNDFNININIVNILQLIKIHQYVNLDDIINFIHIDNDIDNNNNNNNNNGDIIVIEDLDEIFNNAFFINRDKARVQIMDIIIKLRKLCELNNKTIILPFRRGKSSFNLQHIGIFIRNMVDNYIVVNKTDDKNHDKDTVSIIINSVFDNIPKMVT